MNEKFKHFFHNIRKNKLKTLKNDNLNFIEINFHLIGNKKIKIIHRNSKILIKSFMLHVD
jgi:hypothetical protein